MIFHMLATSISSIIIRLVLAYLTADFPAIFGVLPLPRLGVSAPRTFTATTFKSRFSRCLNCLESFTRVDSTPKMADFGHREKG